MLMRHDTLYGRPCRHDASGRIIVPPAIVAPPLAFDRVKPSARSAFIRAKKLEARYVAQLRRIAKHIGDIVREFPEGTLEAAALIHAAMERYAKLLDPWAQAVGQRMVTEVAQRDEQSWKKVSAQIGRALADEIAYAPTGTAMQRLMGEQVSLITSLPTEAAERVHKMTLEGITNGERASSIAAKILETGDVTASRATLIARTEVARTSSILTQVRAEHVGCTHYIWRTAKDSDVRKTHKRLEGKVIAYNDPPECDPGHRAHPGQIWNCFPGDERVSLGNGLRHIWRAPFHGQVIQVVTERGSTTATPNHPILTDRGWVAAAEIREGDYLVQALDDAHLVVNRHKDQPLPTFEDVFRSLQAAYPAQRESRFRANFHGDIPDGDVDYIAVDPLLPVDRVSQSFERGSDFTLTNADRRIGGSVCGRSFDHPSVTSGPGFEDETRSGFGRQLTHSDQVGIPAVAQGTSRIGQSIDDCASLHAMSLRQRESAFTGQIGLDNLSIGQLFPVQGGASTSRNDDPASPELLAQYVRMHTDACRGFFEQGSRRYQFARVVDQRVRNFAGHVYTIETFSGWYSISAAGFVAKNCRCYAEPILPE